MKAAAPQALLLPSVQKKTAAKAPALANPGGSQGRVGRPGAGPGAPRSAADAFSRIVLAKLQVKSARTQGSPGRQGRISLLAEALEAAVGEAAGERAAGQAPAASLSGAVGAAKKKSTRSSGASSTVEGESPAVGDARDALLRLPTKQAEARRDPPDVTVPSVSVRRSPEPKVYVLDLRRTAEKGLEESRASGRVLASQVVERETAGLQGSGRAATRESSALGAKGRTGRTGGSPAPFESALERLRSMAGSELVKTSGIILRDGGGEIRLVLKPESLGSVRIRMNIVDNGIEGRIIVDTQAVKQVLDGSMDSLARALTEQGFQTASLQVSVGGQNADGGREAEQAPSGLRRESADGFERNVPGIESLSLGDLLVNLFA